MGSRRAGRRALALVNRWLPAPGGIGHRGVAGAKSESALTRAPLTLRSVRAALRNDAVP